MIEHAKQLLTRFGRDPVVPYLKPGTEQHLEDMLMLLMALQIKAASSC